MRTFGWCTSQRGAPDGPVVDTTPVQVRPLAIDGALEITPLQHGDDRGVFLEWFTATSFRDAVGHDLELAQANCSVSAAGVLRGIHFSDVPPGQAKYVTCPTGAVLDVVVDIRVGSPTFGRWDSVLLDDTDRRGIYLAEGLGHAFMSLVDGSTVVYLCSTGYSPGREHGVHPLDPSIGITWPTTARDGTPLEVQLSDKDLAAPLLAAAAAAGMLPTLEDVERYVGSLASSS
jgi:dTDP-4-dehydrorhamnose 3,5-epimerase